MVELTLVHISVKVTAVQVSDVYQWGWQELDLKTKRRNTDKLRNRHWIIFTYFWYFYRLFAPWTIQLNEHMVILRSAAFLPFTVLLRVVVVFLRAVVTTRREAEERQRCSLLLSQMQHLSETSSAPPALSDRPSLTRPPPHRSLAPLHAGKWFHPVEWLCKDGRRAKGFKAESGERGREKKDR